MENCKYCQAELEENSTVCPVCGKDNAEQQPEETVQAVEETAAEVTEETAAEIKEEAAAEVSEEAAASEPTAPAEETPEPAITMKEGTNTQKIGAGKIALYTAAIIVLTAVFTVLIINNIRKQGPTKPTETAPVTEVTEAQAPAAEQETVEATVPADGNPDDVTCKGTYYDTDEAVIAASDTVVAKLGDKELTNGQLQIFYWMGVQEFVSQYSAYIGYLGLDLTQDLATQPCPLAEGLTWQQYFLDNVLTNWQYNQAMAAEAEANDFVVAPELAAYLDALPQQYEAAAAQYNVPSVEEFLHKNYGGAATMENIRHFYTVSETGGEYYRSLRDSVEITDEDIENYFQQHEAAYADNGLTKATCTVDVRHILVFPEGADAANPTGGEYTDEQWAAGEKKAQAILDSWLADKNRSEETFAALANEKSGDPGSNTNGGLYTGVSEGQMVPAFNDWCFDPARQEGDTGVVKTEYGFHVMYFVGRTPLWKDTVRKDMLQEAGDKFLQEALDKYELSIDYSAIKLANINFGA